MLNDKQLLEEMILNQQFLADLRSRGRLTGAVNEPSMLESVKADLPTDIHKQRRLEDEDQEEDG